MVWERDLFQGQAALEGDRIIHVVGIWRLTGAAGRVVVYGEQTGTLRPCSVHDL